MASCWFFSGLAARWTTLLAGVRDQIVHGHTRLIITRPLRSYLRHRDSLAWSNRTGAALTRIAADAVAGIHEPLGV
jgi:hypothetical protein